jgi:O-antigen ligase
VVPLITNAPRWIFLAALVFAPWAYGSTRPWSIAALDAIMLLILALWLLGCLIRRARPVIPWPLWTCALLLLAQGWIAIANPQGTYDRINLVFIPLHQFLPTAPGVIDRVDAIPALVRQSALLGILCFVTDLVRRRAWRTRVWWTLALTGISIVLCGLVMKIAGYHITSYKDESDIGWNSFALYFYHANAGAYINLVIPLVAGLAALAFLQPHAADRRALWMPGTILCIAGAVATLSKGAMVISLLLLFFLVPWFIRRAREKNILHLSPAVRLLTILGAVVVLAAILLMTWPGVSGRWAELAHSGVTTHNPRLLAYTVCTRMFLDSGPWGFGPGNFTIAFPHYTGDLGHALAGVWIYAHEDYLQTIIEWGFIGAAIWAIIFFIGIRLAIRTLRTSPLSEEDSVLLTMTLLALAGVAIHALFDFPLQIASIQLYTATLLALCWSSRSFVSTDSSPRRRRRSTSPQNSAHSHR